MVFLLTYSVKFVFYFIAGVSMEEKKKGYMHARDGVGI